ncbi:hypothetical protein ES332_A12G225900v1 [Gossypium tomentosum]|uniref:Uncharacterized protein n=1 Tax=Gossypium tomentosum TaxID=34277 RepID=A0A5D2MZX8_GOSTO|nr:hypothetical protein ES332_A12G225900v1 [Gossypium tomentosum]
MQVLMYGAWWSYDATLAVRTKGCLVATAAPSRNPRVLSWLKFVLNFGPFGPGYLG